MADYKFILTLKGVTQQDLTVEETGEVLTPEEWVKWSFLGDNFDVEIERVEPEA